MSLPKDIDGAEDLRRRIFAVPYDERTVGPDLIDYLRAGEFLLALSSVVLVVLWLAVRK